MSTAEIIGTFKTYRFGQERGHDKRSPHDLVAEWLTYREMDPTLPLPEHGFVVTYMDIPVCVVGLRPCDGTTGMIDGLTTNPEISAFIRNKALEVFAVEIELLAKSMGLKAVLAVSEDSHTLQRALKHGYKLSPGILVTKRLGE